MTDVLVLAELRPETQLRRLRSYGLAILLVTVAAGVRVWPLGSLGTSLAWLTFYPVVMVTALFGGFWAGILATSLACLVVLVAGPILAGGPFIRDGGGWIGLAVFLLSGTLISAIAEGGRRANDRANRAREQAEAVNKELEAADAALRDARAEADRANRAKTDFLSRMSHELRTPLNSVLGFSELLALDPLTDEQRENVGYIAQAGRHLLDLINEVLDISRIESGQMTISPEPVAVGDLLDEVVALVGPLGTARRIVLDASDATCTRHVLADRQRLKQVLLNLLANAVKYNRDGGTVTVGCGIAADDRLRISVRDTGYGIAPERLRRLFIPFERLGAEQGPVEGTGMGLVLSKGLIEAMGGRIEVESTLDVGSTFSIELGLVEGPLEAHKRGRPPARVADPTAATRVRRVLYVEDNLSNVRLVERILSRRPDIGLLTAMQASLGIELAREHQPDVILLDLHLPDAPGRDVLARLKTHPDTRRIPVIILSADATKTQVARLLEEGAFGYLTKPLEVRRFLELLDAALEASEAAG